MSYKRFLFMLTMLAVLTMAVRISVASDTWWHLRAGAWIVEHRAILDTDPFSLTRQGQAWIYPGWMAQLSMYFAYSAAGYAGLNVLTAIFVLGAFIFLWDITKGRPLAKSCLILLAATTSAVYWSARPHIFSFFLASVFLWILEKERGKPGRLIWMLPVLMGLWANMHGGFAIGFILIATYLLGEISNALGDYILSKVTLDEIWHRYRVPVLRLVGVGLLSALLLGLNPHGFKMLAYPFKTVSIGTLQNYIQEWQSPDFHQLQVQPFLGMLLLSLVAFAITRERIQSQEVIGTLIFTAMALLAVRNIALFALVMTPTLARHFDSALDRFPRKAGAGKEVPERLARRINLLLLTLLIIPAGWKMYLPLTKEANQEAVAEAYPMGAIDYLKRRSEAGEIFNSYNWGAYLIWELYPDYLSFVDGRTDLFDDAILEKYLAAWRGGAGWAEILAEWDIKLVLVEPDAPLRLRLDLAGWDLLYVDGQAVVMGKPSS
jgi:hypothetical protein